MKPTNEEVKAAVERLKNRAYWHGETPEVAAADLRLVLSRLSELEEDGTDLDWMLDNFYALKPDANIDRAAIRAARKQETRP